jgi:hypothetical protein
MIITMSNQPLTPQEAKSTAPPFGQPETIAELLRASKRTTESVPLRRTFVQLGTQKNPQPGPLSKFVSRHDEAGLELYLLFRAVASSEPWNSAREAGVWARALGVAIDDTHLNRPTVSRVFRRLDETHNLVSRERSKRRLEITALDESGSREPYTMPSTGYIRWPYAYWTDGWHRRLSMPARAVLLIGMTLTPPFILPLTQVHKWYGISDDTVSKGISELRKHNLISSFRGKERDWLTGPGYRHEIRYTLRKPFHRAVKGGAAASPVVGAKPPNGLLSFEEITRLLDD